MISLSSAGDNLRIEERRHGMKRNQELCIQIMKTSRSAEVSMPSLSYRDFEGITVDIFVEHCKLLDGEGLVEAQLAFGGVAHIRLTPRGHDFLDGLDQERPEGSTPMEVKLNVMAIPEEIELEKAWRLGAPLGEGGFAKVYLAQNEKGEPAVIKLVPKDPGAQRELLFEELNGVPHVVPIIDSGDWDDHWVLVMPQADKSLRDHLGEVGGGLPTEDAVSVLVDLAEALVAVEDKVVHRDIKPENILLLDGCWHLADFGIARYAEATTASDTFKYCMTSAYAAPEQWRGERATSATDVYAFGVVAHELLTGERPFDGPDYRHQHLEESPKAMIGIPEKLRSLVGECLYKGPGARPLPQNLLARLRASMGAASPAGARLQQANAVAVELRAEAARQQSAAHAEADRRGELYADADRSLANMLAMLDRQIKDNAPAVRTSSDPYLNRWELNNAAVWVNFPAPVGLGRDRGLPFEVIAHTKISVSGSADRSGYTGRSHSLWYCDAQEKGTFRWYETAFMETFGTNTPFAPFAMPPEASDTAKALSPALHTHQVAWPFMPIDQGDEGSFVERWMGWFGEASQGQLRCPARLPELEPHSSWRRGS